MLRASGDRDLPDEVRSHMEFQGSKRRAMWWLGLVLVVSATACTGDCLAGPRGPGITLTLLDAATGAPVPDFGIVIATEGTYADTVQAPGDVDASTERVRVFLAWGREGVYTVTVQAPGYQAWQQAGVQVRRGDACVVVATQVTARPMR
jgi:multidrug efflux pump subunit AcrA (membrane-fusion protein)